jgi:hypothetical protein
MQSEQSLKVVEIVALGIVSCFPLSHRGILQSWAPASRQGFRNRPLARDDPGGVSSEAVERTEARRARLNSDH